MRHLLCTSPTLSSCVHLGRKAPSLHSISTMGITTTYGDDGSRPTCHDHGGRSPWRYIHSVAGSSAVSFSVVSFFFCILSCICLNFGLTTAMMDYVHIVTLSCILLPLSMTTSTITVSFPSLFAELSCISLKFHDDGSFFRNFWSKFVLYKNPEL